jgi:multiple sugar transport system permease protein
MIPELTRVSYPLEKKETTMQQAAPLAPVRLALAPRPHALSATRRAETLTAWCLVCPAAVGFLVFYAWPTLRAVQISFTDWNLLRAPKFVGFDNYVHMLHDGKFWLGMKLSAYYVALNIPMQTVLGLFLAVAMDRLARSLFVKSVVLLPYLLSNVLVAMMWLWMLDPVLGWVNSVIASLGFDRQPFFGGVNEALLTVAAVNIWRHMGLVAMLFLAGLQNIPRHLYEAASLEGASEWQMFWRITLPLLRPVMVFVLVTSVTGSFQIFDTIAVTTNGGPLDSTRVIVHYIVQNAFGFYKMGYASAMSMALCLVMLAYTVVQMRILRASENDLA